MSLAILGVHPNEIVKLTNENLITISKGNWDMYWALTTEYLKVEYIGESIFIHSSASLTHEKIFGFLLTEITRHTSEGNLGEILGSRFPIELEDGRRAEPDFFFISKSDIKSGELSETFFKGRISWVIEIISPNYREHDTITKREEYRKLNVKVYWIIDPYRKNIEIINFENQREIQSKIIDGGDLKPNLAGFENFRLKIQDILKLK